MDRIKVGVVGTGGIFQGAHLPAYPEVKEAKLTVLCDISSEALKTAERRMKNLFFKKAREAENEGDVEKAERLREDAEEIKVYKSPEEMFEREDLDVVDVCTPTKFHNTIAMEALKSGLNVMVEKPMARTYIECLDVMEAVEDTGRLYQHNENWIYDITWYTIKKFIESEVIGEPQYIIISQTHGGPEWASWFWIPEIAGGGSLLDNGVHAITTSWFLSKFEKKPVTVKAAEPYGICIRMKTRIIQGAFKSFAVEDDAHILVRYEDDSGSWCTAQIEGSWSYRDSMETKIIGTGGEITPTLEDGLVSIRISSPLGERTIPIGKRSWILSFVGEIRNMCNCILNGEKPLCDERIGAETTAIVQAAYLSQKKGKKPVSLEEFKEYALKLREKAGEDAPKIMLKEMLEAVKPYM